MSSPRQRTSKQMYIPISNRAAVAACQRRTNIQPALPPSKEHKQSFANNSKQALLGTRPGRISPAGSEPRDSAFSQRSQSVRTYRLRLILHPSLRFQFLRKQSEVCQILSFLASHHTIRVRHGRARDGQDNSLYGHDGRGKRKKAMSVGHLPFWGSASPVCER